MRAAFGPRSQADPPRRCVPLAAGSMSWQVVAWFTSILAGPTSELAGELLNLTGFANHRHRKSVFGGLVDLGLQGRRHLQQVGAFAGDLPPARIFRSLALLLVLLRGSGSLCGYTSRGFNAGGGDAVCAWLRSIPTPAAPASAATAASAQSQPGRPHPGHTNLAAMPRPICFIGLTTPAGFGRTCRSGFRPLLRTV